MTTLSKQDQCAIWGALSALGFVTTTAIASTAFIATAPIAVAALVSAGFGASLGGGFNVIVQACSDRKDFNGK